MANHYILSVSSLAKTFSVLDAGNEVSFELNIQDKTNLFNEVNVGDNILGYVGMPVNKIQYLFVVNKKEENCNAIGLTKHFDVKDGSTVSDVDLLSKLETNELIAIPNEKFISILNDMLKFVLDITNNDHARVKGNNILYYGVPGCGKSHLLEITYGINEAIKNGYAERVVFHPDYTYSDFVGQIMPEIVKIKQGDNNDDEQQNNKIIYDFVEGPFTRILKKATNDADVTHQYYLVIEEITRGNAAAIFGDIFQLLDRLNGKSEFGIYNADIAKKVYGENSEGHLITIPDNLTILATMNTSDQNVFPLDNAFKRRWQLKMVPNVFANDDKLANQKIVGTEMTWKQFNEGINKEIVRMNVGLNSLEDKRLGTHFVKMDELLDKEKFSEKVLMYLWNDALRLDRNKIFKQEYNTLDNLIEGFLKEGMNVFIDGVYSELIKQQTKGDETNDGENKPETNMS